MFNAIVLADSISSDVRLVTVSVTLPRIVLAEMNTHRVLSRGTASSRAIPVKTRCNVIEEHPFVPTAFGKNKKGMQADAMLDPEANSEAEQIWREALADALRHARRLEKVGVHKQYANRLTEPFAWVTQIITATEWENFFALRCHIDAQPEIQVAAGLMREAIARSTPTELREGEWHLPLVKLQDTTRGGILAVESYHVAEKIAICSSVARCAAVSYERHNVEKTIEEEVARHDQMLSVGHMCYDDQTEVLTRRGWILWSKLETSDAILAVNLTDGTGSFERPSAIHSYLVNESLYHVCGQQLDLKVTGNHNMVVSSRHKDGSWTPFRLEKALAIQGKPRRYLKATSAIGSGRVPAYEISERFMALLGFTVGDGYAIQGNQVQFHLKKHRKVAFLYSLGFPTRALENHKYVVDMPGIGTWFRENCYSSTGEKLLPSWVLDLDEAQGLSLLEGLRNSDGSLKRDAWFYCTTSTQVANMLQAFLHTRGLVGCLSYTKYGDNSDYIKVSISKRTKPRVETGQAGRSLTYSETLSQYSGLVFCATVSTGALMVRRNGHVAISGNSPFEHQAKVATREEIFRYGVFRAHQWNEGLNNWIADTIGNLRSPWLQYRKTLPGERVFGSVKAK